MTSTLLRRAPFALLACTALSAPALAQSADDRNTPDSAPAGQAESEADEQIVVSAIAPGAFPTDMNRAARDEEETTRQRIPAGRVGQPEDLAAAAIYLASRAGDYVVGETLVVDGGVAHAR